MTKPIEDKLDKIPVVNVLFRMFKRIKLPGLEGLTFYDLLELYITGIAKGAITTRASAIAFSFFMALFPFLLFVLIIIPYVPIDDFKIEFLRFLESFLPPRTSDFFFESIFEGIDNSQRGGLISSVFVLSIALTANGVNALFSGFQNSYHQQLSRNFFRQYLVSFGVALILAFLLIITIAALGYFQIFFVQKVLDALNDEGNDIAEQTVYWFNIAKYAFFVFIVYIATATMYYFGTKEGKYSKFFSIGAGFTTFLIISLSFLFGIYIENFGQYNKLYGSIGALLILMVYLWLNANILLLGYDLNAAISKLRRRN